MFPKKSPTSHSKPPSDNAFRDASDNSEYSGQSSNSSGAGAGGYSTGAGGATYVLDAVLGPHIHHTHHHRCSHNQMVNSLLLSQKRIRI